MPKIFLNYDQQIEKLKSEKNLRIDDTAYATAYATDILRQTSYYSLIGGYKDMLQNRRIITISIMRRRNMEMFHCGY